MKCTTISSIIFAIDAVLYGVSYAGVAQGLKYFSAGVFQTFRMLFGLLFMTLIVIMRSLTNKDYRNVVRLHFSSGIKPIILLMIGGIFNLALPHCLTAIAQGWVASSVVQIFQPFIPLFGSVVSHFFLPEERFTCQKTISLVLAVAGIALSSVPNFLHGSENGTSIGYIALGYSLTLLAMASFGIAPVFFKLMLPNIDDSVSVIVQLIISTIFEAIFGLIKDGPKSFIAQIKYAPPIAWMWPVVIGSLVSGVAVCCVMYLIRTIGVFGANLVPFGQLVVGLIVGVLLLNEWKGYKWWEMVICVVGILILIVSLIIGVYQKKEIGKVGEITTSPGSSQLNDQSIENELLSDNEEEIRKLDEL